MMIKDFKVTAGDFINNDVKSLPVNPSEAGFTASALQARFDHAAENIIALDKHNGLIDALSAQSGATEIGTTAYADIDETNAAGFMKKVADLRVSYKTLSAKYLRVNNDKVLETSPDDVNWQATGSSGHIICKGDGTEMPQRARMKFTNCEMADDGTSTVIHGVKGEAGIQGIQGIQGEQGIQGAQGVKGDKGEAGIQGMQGMKGDKGDRGDVGAQGSQGIRGLTGADGRSFTVLALFPTLFDLQRAHPLGAAGDAYAIGSTANNIVYIWDSEKKEWVSIGAIQGPEGIQGIKGDTGVQGVKGDRGEQGVQGIQGIQGERGLQGQQGVQGIKGDTGVQGVKGDKGDVGAQGMPGEGIPTGGSAGQLLVKVSGIDRDTQWSSQAPNAEKLGNQPPAYYAKKTEVDAAVCASATPRGYSMTDANGMNDGWALCQQNLPPSMQGWAYVLQTSFTASGINGKGQIAISYAYEPATVATRFYSGGNWLAWQEMLPKTGGTMGGNLSMSNNSISNVSQIIASRVDATDAVYTKQGKLGFNGVGVQALMQNDHLEVLNYEANAYVPVMARAFSVGTAGNLSVFNGVGLALFAHDAVYMRNSANTAYVNTYGASFTNPSSRTTKHDIKDMSESEAMNILKVRSRTFIYNEDVTGKIQSGAVVEELEEAHIFENVIARDKDGKSNGIDYSKFTAAHIKLTQMHHARITALETENDALKTQLAAMETRIAALEGKQCI